MTVLRRDIGSDEPFTKQEKNESASRTKGDENKPTLRSDISNFSIFHRNEAIGPSTEGCKLARNKHATTQLNREKNQKKQQN